MFAIDLSFLAVAARIIATVVTLTAIGAIIATVARALGDAGPLYDGRVSLNPFRHLDIWALACGICLLVGWVRTLELEIDRSARWRPALIGVIAIASSFALAGLALLLTPLVSSIVPANAAAFAGATMHTISWTCLIFGFVNLLPFPPFAGGYVLQSCAPELFAIAVRQGFWLGPAMAIIAFTVQLHFSPHAIARFVS